MKFLRKSNLAPSRLIFLISAIVGSLTFFLPFLRMKSFLYDYRLDGFTFINFFTDLFGLGKHGGARKFFSVLMERLTGAESMIDFVKGLALWFIILGPLIFLFINGTNLIRAIRGQKYRRGILLAVMYVFLSWLFLWYGTSDMLIKINFFKKASFGFWIGLFAIMAAFGSGVMDKISASSQRPQSKEKMEEEEISPETEPPLGYDKDEEATPGEPLP